MWTWTAPLEITQEAWIWLASTTGDSGGASGERGRQDVVSAALRSAFRNRVFGVGAGRGDPCPTVVVEWADGPVPGVVAQGLRALSSDRCTSAGAAARGREETVESPTLVRLRRHFSSGYVRDLITMAECVVDGVWEADREMEASTPWGDYERISGAQLVNLLGHRISPEQASALASLPGSEIRRTCLSLFGP
jgi:hypothetical protein